VKCIGENHVDSSLGRNGLVETIKVGRIGNVSLNASDITANYSHGLVEFLLTTARDEYVSPFLDEELCCCQTYPTRASSNDRHFSLQLLSFGHR
jgi:hypothetical protein